MDAESDSDDVSFEENIVRGYSGTGVLVDGSELLHSNDLRLVSNTVDGGGGALTNGLRFVHVDGLELQRQEVINNGGTGVDLFHVEGRVVVSGIHDNGV